MNFKRFLAASLAAAIALTSISAMAGSGFSSSRSSSSSSSYSSSKSYSSPSKSYSSSSSYSPSKSYSSSSSSSSSSKSYATPSSSPSYSYSSSKKSSESYSSSGFGSSRSSSSSSSTSKPKETNWAAKAGAVGGATAVGALLYQSQTASDSAKAYAESQQKPATVTKVESARVDTTTKVSSDATRASAPASTSRPQTSTEQRTSDRSSDSFIDGVITGVIVNSILTPNKQATTSEPKPKPDIEATTVRAESTSPTPPKSIPVNNSNPGFWNPVMTLIVLLLIIGISVYGIVLGEVPGFKKKPKYVDSRTRYSLKD